MDQDEHQKIQDLSTLPPKHQAFAILRAQGINQSDASKMLGFTKSNGCLVERKLNRKYDLTAPWAIKLANLRVRDILKAEPFGCVEKIKDSTVLEATKMIYDRVQPVKSSEPTGHGNTYIQVNINQANGTSCPSYEIVDIPHKP